MECGEGCIQPKGRYYNPQAKAEAEAEAEAEFLILIP